VNSGKKVINTLLWDFPKVKRFMALRWKGIGVEGDERVFGSMLLERIVKSEKACEIIRVCNECCPYFDGSVSAVDKDEELLSYLSSRQPPEWGQDL
jgi:hypothetical protein